MRVTRRQDTPTVAAIDPGTEQSALVVLHRGTVVDAVILPNLELLRRIRMGLVCDLLAIEQIESYGMAVGREIFDTVFWAGRFAEAHTILRPGATVELVPRRAVKLHLCNSPRAKDSNVRQALIDRYGGKACTRKGGALSEITSHKWAALAVAVTVAEGASRLQMLSGTVDDEVTPVERPRGQRR